jgi:hypothetical protein
MEAENQRGDCSEMSDEPDDFEASTVSARAYLDAVAEADRLRADNARLRDALAPFAVVADRPEYTRTYVDDDWFGPSFRIGAFRRARKALEASNGNQ